MISGILILGLVTSAWVGATQFLKATYHTAEMGGNMTDFSITGFYHCRDIAVSLSVFIVLSLTIFSVLCPILHLLVLNFMDNPLLPPLHAL